MNRDFLLLLTCYFYIHLLTSECGASLLPPPLIHPHPFTEGRRQSKPNAQVYIGDLHPDVTEDELQQPFEKFGPIR